MSLTVLPSGTSNWAFHRGNSLSIFGLLSGDTIISPAVPSSDPGTRNWYDRKVYSGFSLFQSAGAVALSAPTFTTTGLSSARADPASTATPTASTAAAGMRDANRMGRLLRQGL